MKKEHEEFLSKQITKLIKKDLNESLQEVIQDWFFTEKKAYVEYVDSGYDVSSFGRQGNLPFSINDYKSVQDFLDEPTGNSVPTFVSGSGMGAERYEDLLQEKANELIFDYKEKAIKLAEKKFSIEDADEYFEDYEIDDEHFETQIDILCDLSKKPLMDILGEDIPDENKLSYWDDANKLIEQLSGIKKLYITLSGLNVVGTFAEDNWDYLLNFWIELLNSGSDASFILVIRHFSDLKIDNIPLKRVAAVELTSQGIFPIDAEDFKQASSYDYRSGEPIVIDPTVNYISFAEMTAILNIK